MRELNQKAECNYVMAGRFYRCKECGDKFRNEDDFVRHSRPHFGIRPYMCTVCGKLFLQLFWAVKHVEKKHGYIPANIHIVDILGRSKNH